MYSYRGQGSPSVLSYQYGTERYVTNDSYLSGLGVETFDPTPKAHQPIQNNPELHRQNIYQSGQMPMQRGQANVFPTPQGKGQSYASSNLDSYVFDKHSSTHNYAELESLGYMQHTNSEEDQIKMLYRMGKFNDIQVKKFRYRVFENGLIQIISPSPYMVGRIISEQKRPKLYHSILKSILEEQEMYGNILQSISQTASNVQDTADNVQNVIDETKSFLDGGSSSKKSLTPAQLAVFQQRLTPTTSSQSSSTFLPKGSGVVAKTFGDMNQKSTLEKALMVAVPVGLTFFVYKTFFAKKRRR